jgi:hypothetical protein
MSAHAQDRFRQRRQDRSLARGARDPGGAGVFAFALSMKG